MCMKSKSLHRIYNNDYNEGIYTSHCIEAFRFYSKVIIYKCIQNYMLIKSILKSCIRHMHFLSDTQYIKVATKNGILIHLQTSRRYQLRRKGYLGLSFAASFLKIAHLQHFPHRWQQENYKIVFKLLEVEDKNIIYSASFLSWGVETPILFCNKDSQALYRRIGIRKSWPKQLRKKKITASTGIKPSTAAPISTTEKISHNTSRATRRTKNLTRKSQILPELITIPTLENPNDRIQKTNQT